jgi:hypothetical protein
MASRRRAVNSSRKTVRRALGFWDQRAACGRGWTGRAVVLAWAVALSLGAVPLASATTGPTVSPLMVSQAGSSNVVYLVATTGCIGSRCLRLYRTSVNATRFMRLSLPPLGRGRDVGGTTLNQLAFANENDGYLVAAGTSTATLYATTNDARSWQRVLVVKGQIALTVTASDVFMRIVNCIPITSKCGQMYVRRSTLSLKRWTSLPVLWKTGSGAHQVLYGPSIASYGTHVWELETAANANYLWTSHNNGRTFSRVREAFPVLVSINGCEMTPMSATALWAECPTGMQVSFWHTSDAGRLWRPVKQAPFAGTGGGEFDAVSANLAYIDYGSDSTAVRLNLYRVTDAGRRSVPVSELACTSVDEMTFTDASHGLVDCTHNTMNSFRTELLRTSDGGVTWSRVRLPKY